MIPRVDQVARTDQQGRFRFSEVDADTWTVRAAPSGWIQAQRTLPVGAGEREELVLRLPEGTRVSGRVLLPETVDPTAIAFMVRELDGPPTMTMGMSGPEMVELDDEARFALGPMPAGDWALMLGVYRSGSVDDPTSLFRRASWASFHTEKITVPGGPDLELEVDLSERYPAKVRMKVIGSELGVDDVQTWFWKADGRSRGFSDWRSNEVSGGGARQGADDGVRVLGTVAPGEWRLALVDKDYRWAWVRPGSLRFEVAGEPLLEERLVLESGALRCLDAATGAPLAARELRWDVGLPDDWRKPELVPLRTDAEGRCPLRFPPGELELTVEGYEPLKLTWPSAGGSEATLRFTPRN
jgi:hypothetical protein